MPDSGGQTQITWVSFGALDVRPSGSRRDVGPGWSNANIARVKDEETTQGVRELKKP